MSEDVIPQQVGRYRIEGVLGEGAMAVVYAGFDPDIERKVAIKCLHREIAADPVYRRRFLVEARAAGHLTHPHIVTIFDVGETDDGRSYIAMERLSGETLASAVTREGFPSLPVIIDLVGQLAAALDYAHARGVLHHDVKPENIMLADGWSYAKISDFGIAERRGVLRDAGGVSAEVGGTPAYMALERLRGERTDARSDLFSLGVVLYWLLTGKLPWPDIGNPQQLVRKRLRSPRPPIRPRDPATPSILVSIVRTLLAPAAESRYQRGAEVIEDLRLAAREYEREREDPLATRIISLRLRWASSLGAILSLVLVLGLAAIYAKQSAAVTGVALDFGSSMGRMIASESAENLLLGDQAATRALVTDVSRNRQIRYLAIADRDGGVIASTQPQEVGQRLSAPDGEKYLPRSGDIQSYLSRTAGGREQGGMLLFDVPIHYQAKTVGDLRLGISNAALRAAQRTTLWVIAVVLVLTLAAVVGAAYWLFRRPLNTLDLLGDALLKVARGDFRHRIRLARRDELGRLFAAFNLMNGALQARQHRSGMAAPAAVEDVTRPTRIMSAASEEGAGES
ncbi:MULTISPECIES: protein kinase domain-containing protein [Rhodanobacter]|uniref:protein kinase domain-containing protein n=1 Tax=Rhodanobacter TaxID=75309 RepID=UPI000412A316|nr:MULTISPECIES: protein kinase [Rhodanobacter]KZC18842.1 serine/threonine protein kinase [Rhodanobacter denitrificans]UJJ50259.1 protein kinase [Rhodanobacter denitrificans]UJJ57550.1 protein kinase [Rhodanobacter denitrificans]UJM92974.1 protein kinase [Rhodanobacter denitrificans]UJM96504.1 protein kinase [Rhodanobacter denitrificans]